jgi:hypothetical protein
MPDCNCKCKHSVESPVAESVSVEEFAMALHEAGREVVLQGNTVAAEKFGDKSKTFIEWNDCSENVREGQRIQARYLLDKFSIRRK